jgi:hypothetical protein
MRRHLPARFWFETVTAVIGTLMFVLTLITREWFEALTGIDPDGGSGSLEFALAFGLLTVAVASAWAAQRTFRQACAAQ